MPEAPSREPDAIDAVDRRMPGEQRAVLGKSPKVLVGKFTETPERCVEGTNSMPFGEDELVPLTKVLVEENQHCIEAGQRSAQMPDTTFVVHLQQSATCCGKILRSQS